MPEEPVLKFESFARFCRRDAAWSGSGSWWKRSKRNWERKENQLKWQHRLMIIAAADCVLFFEKSKGDDEASHGCSRCFGLIRIMIRRREEKEAWKGFLRKEHLKPILVIAIVDDSYRFSLHDDSLVLLGAKSQKSVSFILSVVVSTSGMRS